MGKGKQRKPRQMIGQGGVAYFERIPLMSSINCLVSGSILKMKKMLTVNYIIKIEHDFAETIF